MPVPTSASAEEGNASSGIAERAKAALATSLNVAPETLTLVQVEEQEWPNSALGCPSPDQAYMQVIIPGQRITFTDGDNTYAVHTDAQGSRMIWCDAGRATPLR